MPSNKAEELPDIYDLIIDPSKHHGQVIVQ